METYYIVHYPSSWGMGSNTDVRFVTRSNLRKIIANEIEKMRVGNRCYDDRFTGTWNEEIFCDSNDIEEIIDDVIKKRTTTSSTYAQIYDLIEVPSSVPIIITKEYLKNTIFRITNQWGFVRDIIVGDATLIRYKVNLTKCKKNLGLENGKWYEFVEYDFINVMENHFYEEVEKFLENQRYKIERMEKKLTGEKLNYKGKYIDDYFEEFTTTEYYEKEIEEAKKISLFLQSVLTHISQTKQIQRELSRRNNNQPMPLWREESKWNVLCLNFLLIFYEQMYRIYLLKLTRRECRRWLRKKHILRLTLSRSTLPRNALSERSTR